MTVVETIARIRFEHFQNGKGIKRIARELGIARDTVRKVLRSGVTEFVLEATVFPTLELSSPNLSWQGNSIPRRISSSSTFRLGRISRRGTHHCVASWHEQLKLSAPRSFLESTASDHQALSVCPGTI